MSSAISISVLGFAIMVAAVIITLLLVWLTRVKRNKKTLEQDRQAQPQESAVYEEIVCKTPPGSPSVDIDKNIAYDRVIKTTVMS